MQAIKYFLLILTILAYSCSKEVSPSPDLSGIESDPEIIRFEELFYTSDEEQLPDLKSKYPFLFPEPNADSIWVNKMKDEDELYLFSESEKVFKDFSEQEGRLESLFKHMKYYFPTFGEPRVITVISQVDYNNKVIYADSLLFISLDLYLGKEHEVYQNFPNYVKQNYDKDHMIVDIANALVSPVLRPTRNNSFIARMVQEGKRLKLVELMLPKLPKADIMGYDSEQWEWAEISESDIWKYFIQNELLYSTDSELSKRFIEDAPFSKFYMEVDHDSPGRIGAWLGWRIVDSYMSENDVGVKDLILADNEELFRESGYKPSK